MKKFTHFPSSRSSVILVILFSFIFQACDKNDPEPLVPVVYQTSALLTSKTQAEIAAFIKARNLPLPQSEIKYGAKVYKVSYTSTYKGAAITGSGLVILPDTQDAVGMLSFQHGTISANSEAPSSTSATDDIVMFYAAMSTPGFIGVVPDLFGFGASKDVLHPYYIRQATSDAILDNLKAAREFALISGLNFNERLFLAGYSQGGYATMAAHRAIEKDGLEHFKLIASFPAAGGYDIKGVQKYFFAQTSYEQPFYLAFVASAYKSYYNWTQPLTDLFQEPYAGRIPGLINGTNTSGTINAGLTTEVSKLVTADVLAKIDTDAKYAYINTAFAENSLIDWTPKVRMLMYHGNFDTTVPYQNSVDVYNKFIANGASKDVVTMTTLQFANHGTGVTPYIIDFFNQLVILK